MPTNSRTIEWYNQHAADYTRHVRDPEDSIYHSLYEKPAMYALLPELSGKSVISLGCGSGEDCHYLARQGATKVVGIDIAEGLIDVAKTSYPECEFRVMDMEHLDFADNSFDFAYSSLAIHYIEDWTKVLREVHRILKPNAYFLLSCNHPVYTAMQVVQDDDQTKVQELSRTKNRGTNEVAIVGDYVARHSVVQNEWVTWHKSIGEISAEAAGSGFVIANLVEPQPLPRMKEIAPKDYDTLVKIPNFLILKLLKPASLS